MNWWRGAAVSRNSQGAIHGPGECARNIATLTDSIALSSFKYRRNSAYFIHDLIGEPLFRTGKPV